MFAHLGSIGLTREAAFSPRAIEADLRRRPPELAGEIGAQKLARGATCPRLVARVAERVAVNCHSASAADAGAALGDLLVPSAEAARRRRWGRRSGSGVRTARRWCDGVWRDMSRRDDQLILRSNYSFAG